MNKKRSLDKAIKASGLPRDRALEVIAAEWELQNMLNPKDIKVINLNFDPNNKEDKKVLKYIDKVAKSLKVSPDAVISAALINYLPKDKKNGN